MEVTVRYENIVRRNSTLVQLQKDLSDDDRLRLQIHKMLAKVVRPYVPKRTGELADTMEVTADGITWYGPPEYTHYVWEGEIYGPNFLVKNKETGELRWMSPPGKPKHPTGRQMHYYHRYNRHATSHWTRAALREQRATILAESRKIIKRYAKRIGVYGEYYVR